MKNILTLLLIAVFFITAKAQMNAGGHYNPDSLKAITVTGTILADSAMFHQMYYLDTNNDGGEDYHLNFGPYWYTPDSSDALLPNPGDQITISGGLYEHSNTIIVYEINGKYWRDPYFTYWNNFGGHNHANNHHQGGCTGDAFGWNHDTLKTISLNGTAFVDSTFMMDHYYLDVNNDTIPEYLLNFGPWWNQTSSGAERPKNGDAITIEGAIINGINLNIVVVYKINGVRWLDSANFSGHMGGGWIHSDMGTPDTIYNPYDKEDHIQVNPGWHMGGMMMPDSIFCQILELYPQSIPNAEHENSFAGFEIGMFNPDGTNNMWQGGSCGGHMNFGVSLNYQIHYDDMQISGNNIDENLIKVKYWNDQSGSWDMMNNITVNTQTNIIIFSASEVPNYVILTADNVTSVDNALNQIPNGFSLKQNYPNPFNPATIIEFSVKSTEPVELNIYNSLGQKITTLVQKALEAGSYKYQFNAKNLASGVYFYELKAGTLRLVKKMNLLK